MVKYLFEIAKAFVISGIAGSIFSVQKNGSLVTLFSVSVAIVISYIFVILAILLDERVKNER